MQRARTALPQQEPQQILAEGHQTVARLGLQQVGEIPTCAIWSPGDSVRRGGPGREIEPEIAPVQLSSGSCRVSNSPTA